MQIHLKEDELVNHSKHHPDLDNVASPCIKLTTKSYQCSQKPKSVENPTGQPPAKKKAKHLTMFELSDFLMNNNT